jgi:CBS domain containing-hemolysin-like protein
VNDLFGLHLSDEDVDTIGGWILSENMDIAVGHEAVIENYRFKVLELEGYHVNL